jgi:hypothetical protein
MYSKFYWVLKLANSFSGKRLIFLPPIPFPSTTFTLFAMQGPFVAFTLRDLPVLHPVHHHVHRIRQRQRDHRLREDIHHRHDDPGLPDVRLRVRKWYSQTA